MDFTARKSYVLEHSEESSNLILGKTVVACFDSRAMLGLLALAVRDPENIVGLATSSSDGIHMLKQLEPDLLFISDRLDDGGPIGLIRESKGLSLTTKVLLITQDESPAFIAEALEAGCDGICLDSCIGTGTFIRALKAVLGDGMYLEPAAAMILERTSRGAGPPPREALTEREQEVLQEMVRGNRNNEIADTLIVSPETVKSHVSSILSKLYAKDRTHAAVIGLRRGLVSWA
jgi:DNA-binding NarL/FixJ family response regulator